MRTDDFSFELPQELIAQKPLNVRHDSRLMIVDRKNNTISSKRFYQIFDYLNSEDVMVFNNSKVIPARLFGIKVKTAGTVEILLLRQIADKKWECMVNPGRRVNVGNRIMISDELKAEVIDRTKIGTRIIKFETDCDFMQIIHKYGRIPLPPYIREDINENDKYQTIYSKIFGSVAAPTAGFHFSKEIFDKLENNGIRKYYVTLHIGMGTFRPIKSENFNEHKMDCEKYFIDDDTIAMLNAEKNKGRKILAVGTTSARTLEDSSDVNGILRKNENDTDLFIYPGYKFKFVEKLLTNFHIPKSTLFLLVSAFAGADIIKRAYQQAIKEKYRFYSFGDAMLII